MKTLQQMVQDEINRLMSSKSAKFTDAELEGFEKQMIPFELVMTMYSDYINNFISMEEVGRKYNRHKASVRKAFVTYGLKIRSKGETRYGKMEDSESSDIKNGMSSKEWCAKWCKSNPSYHRLRKKIEKDLADSKL